MKKKLFIHIGTPKTGTSSIQHFLYKNQELLETKGVFYPTPCYTQDGILPNLRNIILKSNNKEIYRSKYEDIEKDWQKYFVPVIKQSKCQNIVISEETITKMDSNIFKIFQKDFDIKIIVYIRRPVDVAMADWAQIVTMGYKYSFDKYVNSKNITYLRHVIKHIETVGKENFIIRPYEKEQWKDGNLLADFLDCLGIELNEEYEIPESINISPTRNKTEIVRLITELNLPYVHSAHFNTQIYKAKSLIDNETKAVETMSDEEMEIITENTKPYIEKISEFAGKEKFFVNDYPDCYKKPRPKFDRVVLSLEELEILHNAIKEKREEAEKLEQETRNRFISAWTEKNHKIYKFGKIKMKFKEK